MTGRLLTAAALALSLAVAGAAPAGPLPLRGGSPIAAGGGSTSACGSGGVCAEFHDGQAFVTWPDAATGAAGNSFRYRMYRSTAPIDAGNYASATVIAKYILNNSGQLFGGDPEVVGGDTFTQTNRQDASLPMSVLTDLGTPLADYTGLQVYTATGAGNAYYAIVSTNTSDGSPTFIGSVGPIAETVAEPVAIKFAASGARANNSYGVINGLCASGCPMVFRTHQSGSAGGAPPDNQYGDYWEWFLTPEEGWQDGRATTLSAHQDNAEHYPSLAHSMEVANRDTVWNPLGTGGLEGYHFGLGLSPLNGTANRLYPITYNAISRMLNWTIDHYNVDPNQVHWRGESMGAWGGALTGVRMTSPQFAAIWIAAPIWRFDRRTCGWWPGTTWSTLMPFRATLDIGANTCYLGTTVTSVLLADGTRWGGDGGYADVPGFLASDPGTDLPVIVWQIAKDDPFPFSFAEQVETVDALQAAHRGHAFCWFMGQHSESTGALTFGLINRDWTAANTSTSYGKPDFRLDRAYPAFSNSSIDDDPGTGTRGGNGLYDGDHAGCVNWGFRWNFTSDTAGALNFTVSNNAMGLTPTAEPTTTLTGTIASTSGGGTVGVTNASAFQSIAAGQFFQIGTEVVTVTGVSTGGNTITYLSRGLLGTTAQTHSAGETVTQFLYKPTGPSGGPYSTMTVDVTPRRTQGFHPADGPNVSCTITPFGAGATVQTPTVAAGIWTLTGVTINSGGVTTITCS